MENDVSGGRGTASFDQQIIAHCAERFDALMSVPLRLPQGMGKRVSFDETARQKMIAIFRQTLTEREGMKEIDWHRAHMRLGIEKFSEPEMKLALDTMKYVARLHDKTRKFERDIEDWQFNMSDANILPLPEEIKTIVKEGVLDLNDSFYRIPALKDRFAAPEALPENFTMESLKRWSMSGPAYVLYDRLHESQAIQNYPGDKELAVKKLLGSAIKCANEISRMFGDCVPKRVDKNTFLYRDQTPGRH